MDSKFSQMSVEMEKEGYLHFGNFFCILAFKSNGSKFRGLKIPLVDTIGLKSTKIQAMFFRDGKYDIKKV